MGREPAARKQMKRPDRTPDWYWSPVAPPSLPLAPAQYEYWLLPQTYLPDRAPITTLLSTSTQIRLPIELPRQEPRSHGLALAPYVSEKRNSFLAALDPGLKGRGKTASRMRHPNSEPPTLLDFEARVGSHCGAKAGRLRRPSDA